MRGSSSNRGERLSLRRIALITACIAVVGAVMWVWRGAALPWAQAQSPSPAPAPTPAPTPAAPQGQPQEQELDYSKRVVAYIYDNQPVTRQELGEYLIERLGPIKLKPLINKKIIDIACQARKIEVTPAEVDISFGEELRNLKVDLPTFVKTILPRYKKNLYEWREDVLRPRLMLTRFCQRQVVVTEEEIQHAFESTYGEKMEGRMIIWPKEMRAKVQGEYNNLANNDSAFTDEARKQKTSQLAATGGKLSTFGRYTIGDQKLDDAIFRLAPGQVSELIETEQGLVLFKCDRRFPPDSTINPLSVRDRLIKDVADRKVGEEINKIFPTLQEQAKPVETLQGKVEKHVPGQPFPPPNQVVGYLHGNVQVTREELGEYLIARYGIDRLELLVNQRIINQTCLAQGIQVSDAEVEQGFQEDIKSINMDQVHFEKDILSKWGKTSHEWREDVVRPRLQLAKLARARVKITEEEIYKGFEAYYGEKMKVQMILWPPDQERFAREQYPLIQNSDEEFDRLARQQPTPSLAATHGKLEKPIGHHWLDNEELERVVFQLQPGQISPLVGTPQGRVVVKCLERIAPDKSVTLEQKRQEIQVKVFERKVQLETQKVFAELHERANPRLHLKDASKPVDLVAESKRLLKDLPPLPKIPVGQMTQPGANQSPR